MSISFANIKVCSKEKGLPFVYHIPKQQTLLYSSAHDMYRKNGTEYHVKRLEKHILNGFGRLWTSKITSPLGAHVKVFLLQKKLHTLTS